MDFHILGRSAFLQHPQKHFSLINLIRFSPPQRGEGSFKVLYLLSPSKSTGLASMP
jgi:hypothetical protein